MIKSRFELKNPNELKLNPINIQIYGIETIDAELVDSIRMNGVYEPIIVKDNNMIVSGHRRCKAAIEAGLLEVPCSIISSFATIADETKLLIEYNRQRIKTLTQKMKEKDALTWIENENAKTRQELTRAKPGEKIGEGAAQLGGALPKGEAREKIAEKIGMSRGSMLRATKVWEKAKTGDTNAQHLMEKLDAGEIKINAAYIDVKKHDVPTPTMPPVASNNVFGNTCDLVSCTVDAFPLPLDTRHKADGIEFMKQIPDASIPCVFFDPQYRGVLDALAYGNEGDRQKDRVMLHQMTDDVINKFCREINRVLVPSGHLFLWVDKFHVVEGTTNWFEGTEIKVVDLLTWNKETFGMGFRTRRVAEYLLILQKLPTRAKGVWCDHTIRDVWSEKTNGDGGKHAHKKPIGLQSVLIKAVTREGDIVLDPAAGSFSVMISANKVNRRFVGCDIEG